ncbi:hypothetical protein RvY_02876-2 [Ramazzottius varieornatus]|nr:hypothetical protein RvY_02876-2 [Ramazzottius varieornatus]
MTLIPCVQGGYFGTFVAATGIICLLIYWKQECGTTTYIPGLRYTSINDSRDETNDLGSRYQRTDQCSSHISGCNAMLKFGLQYPNETWRPIDCQMHNYNYEEFSKYAKAMLNGTCPRRLSILLIGDSRIRQLQIAIHRHVVNESYVNEWPATNFCDRPDANSLVWPNELLQACEFRRTFEQHNFVLERWWVPYNDYKTLHPRLSGLLSRNTSEIPAVIVLSAGVWFIRGCNLKQVPFGDCMLYFQR